MAKKDILQNIQADLKVPKGQHNSFGNYNYRNAEDIQEALKPLLAKHGGAVTICDSVIQVGERIYVEATVSLYDNAGELIMATKAYAREPSEKKGMDASQITGAASSYARKYALGGMFLLDDTKDADSHGNGTKPTPPKEPTKTATPPETQAGAKSEEEMSNAQWEFIKKLGAKNDLKEPEVITLVKWVAEQNNIPPKHWKITKLMLPAENFTKRMEEYNQNIFPTEGIPID